MKKVDYNANKDNSNSLQFYTMNKLKQENDVEFMNNNNNFLNKDNYGQTFTNMTNNNTINNMNNNISKNNFYNINNRDDLNAPRKSPFNFNELNIQNKDLNIGNNDGFNVNNNIPLGPMSSKIVDSKIQNDIQSINSIDLKQSNGFLSNLTSMIKLINPSTFFSGNLDNSNDKYIQNVVNNDDDYDILNEPPLLEELGIDPVNIAKYMKCVILFKNINEDNLEWDMAGPILLIGCLGFFLLLAGKIHFGYIYGIGILSCIGTYILLNIMSNNQSIDLYTTMSILGYSLLPIVILAGISVLFSLRTRIGIIMAIFFNMWSTITASRFFEYTVSLKHQRYLIAYPIALLYASFTIVTIF